MSKSNVFCIIVTFNGADWIRAALGSLRKSTVPVVPIVIDNASSDETCVIIEDNFPEAILLRQQTNLGFGRANNIGISCALEQGADYVLLLNQDATISVDMLEILLSAGAGQPEYGILSPMQMTGDGEAIDPAMMSNIQASDSTLMSDLYIGATKDVYSIKLAPAAIWLIRKDALEKVGGFDPIFFLYGEDDDYLNRLRYHGYKLGLVPKARANHAHSYKNRCSWPVKKRAYVLYGFMVQRLKHPQWNALSRMTQCVRCWLRWICREVKRGELGRGAAAAVVAAAAVFCKCLLVFHHRKICRETPDAWLAEKGLKKPLLRGHWR